MTDKPPHVISTVEELLAHVERLPPSNPMTVPAMLAAVETKRVFVERVKAMDENPRVKVTVEGLTGSGKTAVAAAIAAALRRYNIQVVCERELEFEIEQTAVRLDSTLRRLDRIELVEKNVPRK